MKKFTIITSLVIPTVFIFSGCTEDENTDNTTAIPPTNVEVNIPHQEIEPSVVPSVKIKSPNPSKNKNVKNATTTPTNIAKNIPQKIETPVLPSVKRKRPSPSNNTKNVKNTPDTPPEVAKNIPQKIETPTVIIPAVQTTSDFQSTNDDSPFGVLDPLGIELNVLKSKNLTPEEYQEWEKENIKELKIKYGRKTNLLKWEFHEENLGDNYVWTHESKNFSSDDTLSSIFNHVDEDFNMVLVISPSRDESVEYLGTNKSMEDDLQDFIKAAVERYDGDGIDDLASNVKVKYWQAENEPFISPMGSVAWTERKNGTVSGYARYVELLSEAAKSADKDAKIVLGGAMTPQTGEEKVSEEIKETIELLKNKNAFDVVDIHYWGTADNYKMDIADDMRKILDDNGYSYVKIWSTEHGTYVNDPNEEDLPYQSETDQALSLIKRYVYNLTGNLDKVFWNKFVDFNCYGRQGNCGGIYDNIALISDGQNSGESEDMSGVKRLAYYSHALLAEKMSNFDLNNAKIIQETNNIYIYEFTNEEQEKVWIVWNDTNDEKNISLDVGDNDTVKITELVSNVDSGIEINKNDYYDFFNTGIKKSNSNRLSLTLENYPIFIESCQQGCENITTFQPTKFKQNDAPAQTENQNKTPNQTNQNKCGDGICGQIEEKNNLCPEDCDSQSSTNNNNITNTTNNTQNHSSAPSSSKNKQCGDGICGTIEEKNNLCPEDCDSQSSTTNTNTTNTTNNTQNHSSAPSASKTKQCGDGICGTIEKQRNICPEDCN